MDKQLIDLIEDLDESIGELPNNWVIYRDDEGELEPFDLTEGHVEAFNAIARIAHELMSYLREQYAAEALASPSERKAAGRPHWQHDQGK